MLNHPHNEVGFVENLFETQTQVDDLTMVIEAVINQREDEFFLANEHVAVATEFLGRMANLAPLNFMYFREWAMKHPDQHIECMASARECMLTHFKAAMTKISADREYLSKSMSNCGPDAIDAVITEYTNLLEVTLQLQTLGHDHLNLPLPTALV